MTPVAERAEAVQRIRTSEKPGHHGGFVAFYPILLLAEALQPRPPVFVGGDGPPRRAAGVTGSHRYQE